MISKSWNPAESRSLSRVFSWDLARASDLLDALIAKSLMVILVFAALAHGAVEPWSIALVQVAVTFLILLWGVKVLLDRHLEVVLPPATIPILVLLALGLLQSITFPGSAGQRMTLSMDVEATRHAVTSLAFLVTFFVLAANFLITKERLLLLSNVLTAFGILLAIFALIQNFTWDHRLFWLRSTTYSVFGPFVNHNHFAGYMAMLTPIPVGLILTVIRGQARLLYGFAAVMMGTAAFVSGSRSGVISLVGALVFIALLGRRSRTGFRPGRTTGILPVAVVGGAMLAGVLWIGAVPMVAHFAEGVDALIHSEGPDLSRQKIWLDTLQMVKTYPITGTGLGTFPTLYPTYAQTEELFGLTYAHNDYLQVVAEGGLIAGVMVLLFIGIILRAISRGLRSTDPMLGGMSLAAGAGIIAIAIQSLSDTDLQVPSNALLFLVLTAVVSRLGSRDVELVKHNLENES